ncbi:unnamed protein product [Litomosoides sigmodontis]|uniref:Uncharacterized protein n=1 Tax=Litomosoides sigmodontis TaxID=42156 RepID=A0A3P6S2Q5_LITSI|nr:unnamed protein product [Litomosoides sigmodontis]
MSKGGSGAKGSGSTENVTVEFVEAALTPRTPTKVVEEEHCYNGHECCSVWASRGRCETGDKVISLAFR